MWHPFGARSQPANPPPKIWSAPGFFACFVLFLADRRFTAAFTFPITRAVLFRTAEATEAVAEFCVGRFVVFGDFVSDFLGMRAPRFGEWTIHYNYQQTAH